MLAGPAQHALVPLLPMPFYRRFYLLPLPLQPCSTALWDEGYDIGQSSGGSPDWFTAGSVDMWGAAGTGLTVSRGIGPGEGTASGTKDGVAIVIFLVGHDAMPWHEVEQEPVSTIDRMAEGSVVHCIGSLALPSKIRSISRGAG